MRKLCTLTAIALLAVPVGEAMAENFVRNILSSGATTGSTYLTFRDDRDDKRIVAAREDAGSFVASGGDIRGPHLEGWLRELREQQPDLQASDLELASALLAR